MILLNVKSSIILLISITLSVLVPSDATDYSVCDASCVLGDSSLVPDVNIADVPNTSDQERAEKAQLRCTLGCATVGSTEEHRSTESFETLCLKGCLSHYDNLSMSTTGCHQSCLVVSNPLPCRVGCNVSSVFLQRSQREEINATFDCPGVTQVGGLNTGEYAFNSEEGSCRIYTCKDGPTLTNTSVSCGVINVTCPLNLGRLDIGLAECCRLCGGLPVEPTSPPEFVVGSNEVEIALPPLDSSFMTAAESVLVRVKTEGDRNRDMYITLTNSSSRSVTLNLQTLACTNIVIQYAAVNLRAVSQYSPPASLAVAPGAVEEITVSFSEDNSLPQLANLILTWERPTLHDLLCSYEVIVESADSREFCLNQTPSVTTVDRGHLSHTVLATGSSKQSQLLYDCKYRINLTSIPGGSTATKSIQLKYTTADRQPINITCNTQYKPENGTYDIIVNWDVDPLAAAAVQFYDVSLDLVQPRSPFFRLDSRRIKDSSIIYTGAQITQGVHTYYQVQMVLVRNETLFWRKPLLPGIQKTYNCITQAPPLSPTTMDEIRVSDLNHFTSRELLVVSMVVTWAPPLYSNGNLEQFEMRVGACGDIDDFVREWQHINPSRREMNINSLALSRDYNTSDLCLFMRARNQYDLLSNWSTPLFLNISFLPNNNNNETSPAPINPTAVTPAINQTNRHSLPVYGYALIAVAAVVIGIVVCILVLVCCVRWGRRRSMKFDPFFIPTTTLASKSSIKRGPGTLWASNHSHLLLPITAIIDRWEIPPNDLKVFDAQPLGKGYFGEVYKGHVTSQAMRTQPFGVKQMPKFSLTCTVAVKKLKDNALGSEKGSFLKEIEMMKKVTDTENEYSKFVVNMVGCVTVKEPLLLVLEYVQHGDLLKYLRAMKKQIDHSSNPAPYLEPDGAYSHLNPKNIYDELDVLEEKDLLEFSRQIAAGMEYLSDLGIVHRDLACRNILVGDNKNLKISDFGMSRYVPTDEAYVPTSHGFLPVRWLSVESIFQREFTTASDVWSYGIVLWEICTMGAVPYPVYSNREVVDALKQGYRMPKPAKCSPEIFEIMLHCWCELGEDRPKFPRLRKYFDQFLTAYVQERYPYIEIPDQPYLFDRLAPETGQAGRNSFLDDGDTSPINLDGDEAKNSCSSEDTGNGVTCSGEQEQERSSCRLSMLSTGSMELLSDRLPLTASNPSLADSHNSKLNSTSPNPRYVVSPLVHSGSFFTTNFSIEDDLVSQLDRRLFTLSMRRQQVHVSRFKDREMAEKKEKINEDEHQKKESVETAGSKTASEDTSTSNDDYEQDTKGTISNENETEKKFENEEVQSMIVEGSLSEKKKRDYFKFTIPSHGIEFADHELEEEGDESKGLTQSYREVLI